MDWFQDMKCGVKLHKKQDQAELPNESVSWDRTTFTVSLELSASKSFAGHCAEHLVHLLTPYNKSGG